MCDLPDQPCERYNAPHDQHFNNCHHHRAHRPLLDIPHRTVTTTDSNTRVSNDGNSRVSNCQFYNLPLYRGVPYSSMFGVHTVGMRVVARLVYPEMYRGAYTRRSAYPPYTREEYTHHGRHTSLLTMGEWDRTRLVMPVSPKGERYSTRLVMPVSPKREV